MPSNPHSWSRPPLVNRHGICLSLDAPIFDAPNMNVSTASHHLLGPVWIQVVPPVVLFVPKVQIVLIVPNK